MKKLVYSLSLAMIVMAGCNKFEEAVTENYGEGPSIAIDIQAGTPTDSAFTIILTPAKGTTYYSYIIDESDEAEQLNNYTLLKGGYSGTVVLNTATNPTDTIEITDAEPNTTYQVYAVASNDKGIAGKVEVASISTTDSSNPGASSVKRDAENKAATVTFSEDLDSKNVNKAKVTAKYYKEWDILNPVEIPEEEIEVTVSKNTVKFAAPKAPNGAYVTFSWEAGAFLDLKGNECPAFNSGLNMTTGKFTGVYFQVPTVPFAITDANLTAPKDGALVGDWTTFQGVFTFKEAVFKNEEAEYGDITIIYENEDMYSAIKLDTASWYVQDDTLLIFELPKAPAQGDYISVYLADGIITDVLGNPNAEFETEISWYSFTLTKSMILGDYKILYISYFDKKKQVALFDTISIAAHPNDEDSVIIKGLIFDDAEIAAAIDLEFGKMYIPDFQELGLYFDEEDSANYVMFFATADGTDAAEFTFNIDGTISTESLWGIYLLDENYEEEVGWYDVAAASQLVPCKAAPVQARKSAVRNNVSKPAYAKDYGRVLRK